LAIEAKKQSINFISA